MPVISSFYGFRTFAMIRYIVCFLLLFVYGESFAGKNAFNIVEDINAALVNKDTIVLKRLLHDDLMYGHSNGWVEDKRAVLNDLFNGKLVYLSIERLPYFKAEDTSETKEGYLRIICATPKGLVNSRRDIQIEHAYFKYDVIYEGKPLTLKLAVMMVFVKEKGRWQLLVRQSTKIN